MFSYRHNALSGLKIQTQCTCAAPKLAGPVWSTDVYSRCVREMFGIGERGGETLMSNLALNSRMCLTCFMSCFVFSSQGGGLQKWKPLTQSPEPQRYNPLHHSLEFIPLCLYTSSSSWSPSERLSFKTYDLWWWQPLFCLMFLRVVMNFHVFCCPCMRNTVLTFLRPTEPCTVRSAVTSNWTQKKFCAASRDNLLCNLDKDAHGGEESGVRHLVDLLLVLVLHFWFYVCFLNDSVSLIVTVSLKADG